MARYRCYKRLIAAVAAVSLLLTGCDFLSRRYSGSALVIDNPWLMHKKIFLDPGKGGTRDCFRTGTESKSNFEANLTVALMLSDMLKTAGADVKLGRSGDSEVPDYERALKAHEWNPDLLLGISHTASMKRSDAGNYPRAMLWGSRDVQPASFDFAGHCIDELNKIMESTGIITSDFLVYREGGSAVLHEARGLCLAVVCDTVFYASKALPMRIGDKSYLEKEAEAYFYAISRYFKWGYPTADVAFSCPVTDSGCSESLIQVRNPRITITFRSGNDAPGINERSLALLLDGIPIGHRKVSESVYTVDYGKTLYPGRHILRIRFRNLRQQSSMPLFARFTVAPRDEDYEHLVNEGTKLIRRRTNAREGLKMLLAAVSLDPSEKSIVPLMRDIARGFSIIGDRATAEGFKKNISLMYHDKNRASASAKVSANADNRIQIEDHGKEILIHEETSCRENNRKKMKNEFTERIKKFFSRQK